jgi:hypothetical protein
VQRQPVLRGTTVEVHAGTAYIEPPRASLAARGSALAVRRAAVPTTTQSSGRPRGAVMIVDAVRYMSVDSRK